MKLRERVSRRTLSNKIITALQSISPVVGLTHRFYRYPARFSPQFCKQVIREFSTPGDWVCDPFMGGGTTIVEAVANGRRALGIDINPLSTFVASTKTTPLNESDKTSIRLWLNRLECRLRENSSYMLNVKDETLTPHVAIFIGTVLSKLRALRFPRRENFVRCALLRTGQWATERGLSWPSAEEVQRFFWNRIYEMFGELDQMAEICKHAGVLKNQITAHRILLTRSAAGAERQRCIKHLRGRIKLVITSPPYPGVHIVYHRWQVRGRRESAIPYYIAGLNDGHYESYYTLGSRTPTGLNNYFKTLREVFTTMRFFLDPKAAVVQLVAFSDTDEQLPRYLEAMRDAGYGAVPLRNSEQYIYRNVPNRRWYTSEKDTDASREMLLIHRPRAK